MPVASGERPPLPLEALQPLASKGERVPTLDGARMTAIAREALAARNAALVGLAEPQAVVVGDRARPTTMAYGEMEARHPSTLERLDGTPVALPEVLCEIPVAIPSGVGASAETPSAAPVQRFHSSRSLLDRPSTDALLARLPGPGQRRRAGEAQEGKRQQELDLAPAPSRPTQGPQGSAQVTAPGLTHIGTTVSPPRVAFHTQPNDPQGPGLEGPRAAAQAPILELVPRVMLIVLSLLAAAILMPTAGEGGLVSPLSSVVTPGSTPFTVCAFGVLLAAMVFGPIEPLVRASLSAFLGVGLLVFAYLLVGGEAQGGGFEMHPAVGAVFSASVSARIVIGLCVCILPTALAWWSLQPRSVGARVLLVAGVVLVAYGYLALPAVGIGERAPWRVLTEAAVGSPYMGDRIGAALALIPGGVALAILPLAGRFGARLATGLAGLFWASLTLPLIALSLFVSTASSWASVLAPLQAVITLSAALLLVPMALGELLVLVGEEGPESIASA